MTGSALPMAMGQAQPGNLSRVETARAFRSCDSIDMNHYTSQEPCTSPARPGGLKPQPAGVLASATSKILRPHEISAAHSPLLAASLRVRFEWNKLTPTDFSLDVNSDVRGDSCSEPLPGLAHNRVWGDRCLLGCTSHGRFGIRVGCGLQSRPEFAKD